MNTDKILRDILQRLLEAGRISLDDVVNSDKEEIMKTILQDVHKFKITRPKEDAKDKRWFTYVPDATKPNGRKRVCKNTEVELYAFLIEFYNLTANHSLTFSELFEEWVCYKERNFLETNNPKKRNSATTINRYRRDFGKIADCDFAFMEIAKITSVNIENALIEAIKKHQLKEAFVKNLMGYINMAFAYAFRQRYVDANEFERIDKDMVLAHAILPEKKNDSERVLTDCEMSALVKATREQIARHPHYMPNYAILLAIMTGMRVGEIAALRWSDIDNEYIHIDHSEHRLDFRSHEEAVEVYKRGWIQRQYDIVEPIHANSKRTYIIAIGEPKNNRHRNFPIVKEIAELLNEIRALKMVSEASFIFCRKDGSRYTGHDIECAVARRGNEAGVGKTSIHEIRRTWSSNALKNNSRKLVSNLLGHREETNARFYDYDTSSFTQKKDAVEQMCSNVLNFRDIVRNKKEAKVL